MPARQAGPCDPGRAACRGARRNSPARAVPIAHGPLHRPASVLRQAFPIFARRLVGNPAGRCPTVNRGPMGPTLERVDAGGLFRRRKPPAADAAYRQGSPPGPGRGGSYRRGALQSFREALGIWKRALLEGPPAALDVSLAMLRIQDEIEPGAAVVWGPALAIAAFPRPFCRLVGLTSRAPGPGAPARTRCFPLTSCRRSAWIPCPFTNRIAGSNAPRVKYRLGRPRKIGAENGSI